MTPGKILKLLRTAEGMHQGVLAKRAGITQAYLSQLEGDKRVPSLELSRTLAECFQIPVAFLLIDDKDIDFEGFSKLRELLATLLISRAGRKRGVKVKLRPNTRNPAH